MLVRLAAYARQRASGQVTGLLDTAAREERRQALAPAPGVSAWRAALERGRGLVLLDGLDEVAAADQATIVADIQALARQLPPESRIVVATRIAGHTAQLGADFAVLDVLPLNPEQQRRLVLQWYRFAQESRGVGVASRAEAERRADELMRRLNTEPKLALWARTPVLLTFLALLANGPMEDADRGDQPVASTKAVIYRRVLRLILGRWRTLNQQHGGAWHLWEKEQLLLGLARLGALEGGGEVVTAADAAAVWSAIESRHRDHREALDPAELLRALSDEDGALIRPGLDQYTLFIPPSRSIWAPRCWRRKMPQAGWTWWRGGGCTRAGTR